eukprot:scaffold1774_cov121-Isochrysis_galbana.AAC.10
MARSPPLGAAASSSRSDMSGITPPSSRTLIWLVGSPFVALISAVAAPSRARRVGEERRATSGRRTSCTRMATRLSLLLLAQCDSTSAASAGRSASPEDDCRVLLVGQQLDARARGRDVLLLGAGVRQHSQQPVDGPRLPQERLVALVTSHALDAKRRRHTHRLGRRRDALSFAGGGCCFLIDAADIDQTRHRRRAHRGVGRPEERHEPVDAALTAGEDSGRLEVGKLLQRHDRALLHLLSRRVEERQQLERPSKRVELLSRRPLCCAQLQSQLAETQSIRGGRGEGHKRVPPSAMVCTPIYLGKGGAWAYCSSSKSVGRRASTALSAPFPISNTAASTSARAMRTRHEAASSSSASSSACGSRSSRSSSSSPASWWSAVAAHCSSSRRLLIAPRTRDTSSGWTSGPSASPTPRASSESNVGSSPCPASSLRAAGEDAQQFMRTPAKPVTTAASSCLSRSCSLRRVPKACSSSALSPRIARLKSASADAQSTDGMGELSILTRGVQPERAAMDARPAAASASMRSGSSASKSGRSGRR